MLTHLCMIESNTRCSKHPLKGKENIPPSSAPPPMSSTSMAELPPPTSPPSGPFQFHMPLANAAPNFGSASSTSAIIPSHSEQSCFALLHGPPVRPDLFYLSRTV